MPLVPSRGWRFFRERANYSTYFIKRKLLHNTKQNNKRLNSGQPRFPKDEEPEEKRKQKNKRKLRWRPATTTSRTIYNNKLSDNKLANLGRTQIAASCKDLRTQISCAWCFIPERPGVALLPKRPANQRDQGAEPLPASARHSTQRGTTWKSVYSICYLPNTVSSSTFPGNASNGTISL